MHSNHVYRIFNNQGQEKYVRFGIDLRGYGNVQKTENETSVLACVDSPHQIHSAEDWTLAKADGKIIQSEDFRIHYIIIIIIIILAGMAVI